MKSFTEHLTESDFEAAKDNFFYPHVAYVLETERTVFFPLITGMTIEYKSTEKLSEITSGAGGIRTNAFNGRTIESHTFNGGVGQVVFNGNINIIGDSAFTSCSTISDICIPDSVTSIGDSAFKGCTELTDCSVGSGVTTIGNSAFRNCSGLISCTIGGGVTSIGNYAFAYCSGLTSIEIPDKVTNIGAGAFYECSRLTSIDDYAFQYCYGLTDVTIGSGVTSIGYQAFQYCSSLTSCTIGSGVTSIGIGAFYGCGGLTGVTCLATTPPSMYSKTDAFDYTNDCPIYVPRESVDRYKSATGWSIYEKRIQPIGTGSSYDVSCTYCIKGETTLDTFNGSYDTHTDEISEYYINDVLQLKYESRQTLIPSDTISINFTGNTIPGEMFYRINVITAVIGDDVTAINGSAFQRCTCLSSVTIGNSVTSIGESAFTGCDNLASITIPNSVTSIGDAAFCGSLQEIVMRGAPPVPDKGDIFCNDKIIIYVPSEYYKEYTGDVYWGRYTITPVK